MVMPTQWTSTGTPVPYSGAMNQPSATVLAWSCLPSGPVLGHLYTCALLRRYESVQEISPGTGVPFLTGEGVGTPGSLHPLCDTHVCTHTKLPPPASMQTQLLLPSELAHSSLVQIIQD